MTRPAFLDNPHALNVRSSTADPVRYAAAVEHAERSPWQSHDLAVACILILAIVLIVVGVM